LLGCISLQKYNDLTPGLSNKHSDMQKNSASSGMLIEFESSDSEMPENLVLTTVVCDGGTNKSKPPFFVSK
jgi:hypothetical protein